MLRLGIILVFFLSSFAGILAQDHITDPMSIALGNCYTTIACSAGMYNEASLGITAEPTVQLSHTRPFVIKELGLTSLGVRFPLFPGQMQVGMMHYGIPGYQQVNTSLGYGMKLSRMIYAGIGFRYYNTSTLSEWSYLRTLGLSAGILLEPDEFTVLAAHIINPVSISSYPSYGDVIPSLISVGIQREIYESTTLYSEIMYSTQTKVQVKVAAAYECKQYTNLYIGYHSNPHTLSFGSSHSFAKVRLHMAFSYSMRIGVTPALKISYTPGK